LYEERWKQWGSDPGYAQTRISGLQEFGDIIQQIVSRLYAARKEAATRELLQSCEQMLDSADPRDQEGWWTNFGELLGAFADLVEIKEMRCYSRNGKVYAARAPANLEPQNIPARSVLSALPPGELENATKGDGTRGLAKSLSLAPDESQFYVSQRQAEDVSLSTLLVLHGHLRAKYQPIAAEFCRIAAARADFFSLVERQRLAERQYRENVMHVAHDFRTPLQVIVWDLEKAMRLDPVKNDLRLHESLQRSVLRAYGAQDHVERLLDTGREEKKPTNIVVLLKQVMDDFQPVAARHPCRLEALGVWPREGMVRGVEYQLRRAFSNLIENAIKYSYQGKSVGYHFEPYTVTVSVKQEGGGNHVKVAISNYGIGIPPWLLEEIQDGEVSRRAEVPDKRRQRTGMGLGLSIALSVIDEHDGWLEIDSQPADHGPRVPGEEYHRYVTTVDVYLPIVG
jgi:signal transduction histidine kinase